MSGNKQEQASLCPPGCRFEDAQGYCKYGQVMGCCRSVVYPDSHPGPDCTCYEPAEGSRRQLILPPRREPEGYVHRPTARQSLEADPKVLEMYQAGATDGEIADATGWSKRTVCKWRQGNGLPGNRKGVSLTQREAEVIRLYEQGLSDRDIARSIGCGQVAVCRWRQRTGRKANHRQGWSRKGENHEQEPQAK